MNIKHNMLNIVDIQNKFFVHLHIEIINYFYN